MNLLVGLITLAVSAVLVMEYVWYGKCRVRRLTEQARLEGMLHARREYNHKLRHLMAAGTYEEMQKALDELIDEHLEMEGL